MANAPIRVAQLEYDAARERLTGVIGQEPAFNVIAYGGTLPPGPYECKYIALHRPLGECVQLVRMRAAGAISAPHATGNDFFIHGAGPKGNDGGIVPANNAERLRLNQAVKGFPGTVLLLVKRDER